MSAVTDLDRYIQEHEITLDTINQSKLRRNPLAYQHNKLNSSTLTNNSSNFSNNYQHERNITSVENDLLQFINHLKQMQKFRIHQLQQVNALFNYNIDLEDLSNTDLATKAESQQIDENAEFEAFLLGTESKEEESHEGSMIHTSVEHNTLSNTAVNIMTNDDTKQSIEVADDLCFTEEDTIISLRRNRLDRSARLHAVSHALQALHSTVHTSSTTHTLPTIEEHTIKTRTQGNSNVIRDEQGGGSFVDTEQETSPRASVLQLAQRAIALPPRSSLQPTATELFLSSHVSSHTTVAQSRAYTKEFLASLEDDDVPPPPPPPPSYSPYSPDRVSASSTTASCETELLVGTISLQALVEDDLYLSRTSSAVKTVATDRYNHNDSTTINMHSNQRRTIHDQGDGTITQDGRDQCGASLTVNVASPLHHTATQYLPTPTETMKHKPYLVNNARRRSLHSDTNHNSSSNTSSGNPYKSRTSRVRTPPKHPDLSISSIALHSEDGRSRSNSSSSCSSSGASDKEDGNIVGIGFGHRYGINQKTHNTTVRGGNKPREVQWEEWNKEMNSADEEGAEVDSVYLHKYGVSDEAGTGGQNRLVVGKETSLGYSSRGSSSNSNSAHLFELVDALESPVSKQRQHGKHRETGTTQYPQQQQQATLKSSAADRAVTAASHINSYYQHHVCTSQKDDTSNTDLYHNDVNYPDTATTSEAFHSPERLIVIAKSDDSSCTSPVPTTPTFSPLFS